ncbi:thymidylate kinase [Rubritalea squalenifaciens DSM 18772]|uniref:Thymidylate kinase n=2 Tax=Rubritalea TaxID=361050 RepID=A0A1M6HUZ6_9BACT|nr:dTMP kinase [Rubritalea squalenifaciens]SHJ26025.1 thymidylate kinase [Rubritalea squalenifaciens DSM 18772]
MGSADKKGLFIVIEGIDGTGKSTQAKRLAESLREQGETVLLDREPSDGPFGKILRESMTAGRLSPDEELELFHKDRKQHVEDVIQPALARGEHVILDRYYFSTMAYQGARGFDVAELRATNEAFAPAPDLLFILDLPVDKALDRIGARGDTANEFEQRDALQFCRDVFLSVKDEPYAEVIDSTPSLDAIHEQMKTIALQKIKA